MFRIYVRPALLLLLILNLTQAVFAQASGSDRQMSPSPIDHERGANAASPAIGLWMGRVESDNLARDLTEDLPAEPEGSYDSIGLLVDLSRMSKRVDASMNADVAFRAYSTNSIEDEAVGSIGALVDLSLVPNVFSWDFREAYSQGRRNQFAPLGPDNREDINVFASGPQLDVPLGDVTTLAIGGDYSVRRYGESASVDSDSRAYEVGIFRETSVTTSVGLVARQTTVDYTDFNAPPYEIDRLSFRYDKSLATGRVFMEIGTNEIRFGDLPTEKPLFDFGWSRDVTARSRLQVSAGRQFTDTGDLTDAGLIADPTNAGQVLISADPLDQSRVAVSYVLTMTRTDVSFIAAASEDTYIGAVGLDGETLTAGVTLHRSLSARTDFGAAFQKVRREYVSTATARTDDEDATTGVWISRSLARRFNVALAWSRYERQGSQPAQESRYEIRLGYSPTGSAAATMASIGR